MQGQLFTHDFLTRGILDTNPWLACGDAALDAFIAALRRVYGSLGADSTLNEGQTEDELIAPILDLLGWGDSWMSQVNLSESGRDDVLDFLLFPTPVPRPARSRNAATTAAPATESPCWKPSAGCVRSTASTPA